MSDSDCRKCGGEMQQGIALKPELVSHWDFSPNEQAPSRGQTCSYSFDGSLQNCIKCTDCGHSVSLSNE